MLSQAAEAGATVTMSITFSRRTGFFSGLLDFRRHQPPRRGVLRMTFVQITAWLLLALCGAGLALWGVIVVRMTLMRLGSQTVREGLGLPAPEAGWPRLSIIVPVHNEERLLDGCVRSLREQAYERLEMVFVLDRCTDGTAAVLAKHAAADPRIVVVENDSCPDDWAGKCYAAQRGAQRASGDWMLFTDADTRFDPGLARASMALAHDRGLALLSLLSTLTFDHLFERVAQLAAAINLLILYPVARVSRARRPRPFANGQFMLFRRDWYERIGGHTAVKDCLLEDIAAARLVHAHGGRSAVLFADDMLRCSMYETLADFETGWKRIFIEACNRKHDRLRKWGWRTLANGVVLPVIQLSTLVTAPFVAMSGDLPLGAAMILIVVAGWILQTSVLLRLSTVARAPRLAVLLYPLGCWIVGRVLLSGARDLRRNRPVVWGGRRYVLKPR